MELSFYEHFKNNWKFSISIYDRFFKDNYNKEIKTYYDKLTNHLTEEDKKDGLTIGKNLFDFLDALPCDNKKNISIQLVNLINDYFIGHIQHNMQKLPYNSGNRKIDNDLKTLNKFRELINESTLFSQLSKFADDDLPKEDITYKSKVFIEILDLIHSGLKHIKENKSDINTNYMKVEKYYKHRPTKKHIKEFLEKINTLYGLQASDDIRDFVNAIEYPL